MNYCEIHPSLFPRHPAHILHFPAKQRLHLGVRVENNGKKVKKETFCRLNRERRHNPTILQKTATSRSSNSLPAPSHSSRSSFYRRSFPLKKKKKKGDKCINKKRKVPVKTESIWSTQRHYTWVIFQTTACGKIRHMKIPINRENSVLENSISEW